MGRSRVPTAVARRPVGPRSAAAVEGVPKPAPGVLVVPRAPVGVGAVAAVVAVAAVRDAAPAVVRRARSE
ncbi:hypothetical protein GCM10010230_36110 [Streptomyces narbonensis]|nr:hypothetical protein GCM10010230_36110 [Streptomyces narbonensis]